jgi:SAM-dependent methyltransferase
MKSRTDLFAEWVLDHVRPASRVIDIGCGEGLSSDIVARIRSAVGGLAGVDLHAEKLARNPFLTERFVGPLETAGIPDGSFDCAYSVMVLEHIEDGPAFLASVARLLRPGGVFLFITPNKHHYFTLCSRVLDRLALQERFLNWRFGSVHVEDYHSRTFYRLNTRRDLQAAAARAGFHDLEVRFHEDYCDVKDYFPSSLRLLPRGYSALVNSMRADGLKLSLMGRMSRGE